MAKQIRKSFWSTLILGCTGILSFLALIQPWALRQDELPFKAGDVATQDLRAPADLTYVSDILTEQAQAEAEREVVPVYGNPDLTIGRAQMDLLTGLIREITLARQADPDIPYQEKLDTLLVLQGDRLTPDLADRLLTLPSERWDQVQAEAVKLLEQTMRDPVRTEDLESIQQELNSFVSFTLTESETTMVVEMVSPLVVANSFYDPELTDLARQEARNSVEQVTQSFLEGQTIVLHGQLINEVSFEALTQAGLNHARNPLYEYLGAAAVVVVSTLFVSLYSFRRKGEFRADLRSHLLLSGLFLIFLFATRVIIPNRTLVPYLIPIPAFARWWFSALFGVERGLVFSLLLGILAPYGMPMSLALIPYYIFTSLCGVLALGKARRVMQFIYAVVGIALAGMAVIAAYRLAFTETDWIGIATLLGAAVLNGVTSSALVLPLQYLLAQFLGVTTPMQLLEISRPDSRLLNYFLQRAPGTYQHSLQVANLAEQAAETIGADALLTRVGALFHDIGKSPNPFFFIENQPTSQINPHDDLPPNETAAIIIRHVPDGVELAHKYRIPHRLIDFIAEHHGTLITRYQYSRALQIAGGDVSKVDQSFFRYPGPTPQSKETALLMLADGVEARARAEGPVSEEEMRALVRSVIETRQSDGQLKETPLTQRDLARIIDSFVATLQVTYHPRLEYPQEPTATQEATTEPREKEK